MSRSVEVVDSLLAGRLAPERWAEATRALDELAAATAAGDKAGAEASLLVLSRLEFEGRVRSRLDDSRWSGGSPGAGGRSVLLPVGLLCGGLLALVIGLIGGPRLLGLGALVGIGVPCVAVLGSAVFARRLGPPAPEFRRRPDLAGPPEQVLAAARRARSALAGL